MQIPRPPAPRPPKKEKLQTRLFPRQSVVPARSERPGVKSIHTGLPTHTLSSHSQAQRSGMRYTVTAALCIRMRVCVMRSGAERGVR